MRWPPWKPDPEDVKKRKQAEKELEEIRAQWADVHEAVEPLDAGMIRNHLVARAFALRERGDR